MIMLICGGCSRVL